MESTERKQHSTSSKFVPVQYQDEDGNWRVKVISQRGKFDDDSKQVFLDEYSQHGRMTEAAAAAGVTPPTVRAHLDKDKDFAEACLTAEGTYRDRLIAHHQNLVFEGSVKESYDRNGNIVSKETIYPIRLIELELKKHDEGYRDKREVDMKVSGGVLVAPADVATVDEWESKYSNAPTIEGDAQEVDESK